MGKLLRIFTDLPTEEIDRLAQLTGADLREAKTALAYQATSLLHGAEEADRAQQAAMQAFGGGGDWSAVPCVVLEEARIKLVDLVVLEAVAAFKSKREARQRIEGGAVKLDGEPALDPNLEIDLSDSTRPELRLQAGKRRRFRVRYDPENRE